MAASRQATSRKVGSKEPTGASLEGAALNRETSKDSASKDSFHCLKGSTSKEATSKRLPSKRQLGMKNNTWCPQSTCSLDQGSRGLQQQMWQRKPLPDSRDGGFTLPASRRLFSSLAFDVQSSCPQTSRSLPMCIAIFRMLRRGGCVLRAHCPACGRVRHTVDARHLHCIRAIS